MTISRIVLDPGIREAVDRIQQATRTTSPSAAIALMVSRYGRHLVETWELTAAQCPEPPPSNYSPVAVAAAPAPGASPEFQFTEAIEL